MFSAEAETILSGPRATTVYQAPYGTIPHAEPAQGRWCTATRMCSTEDYAGRLPRGEVRGSALLILFDCAQESDQRKRQQDYAKSEARDDDSFK